MTTIECENYSMMNGGVGGILNTDIETRMT